MRFNYAKRETAQAKESPCKFLGGVTMKIIQKTNLPSSTRFVLLALEGRVVRIEHRSPPRFSCTFPSPKSLKEEEEN